jgi:hypothetical protein
VSGSGTHQQTSHGVSGSLQILELVPTSNEGLKESPQEEFCLKQNTLVLSMVALPQLVAALRLVKGQREMSTHASPAGINNFIWGQELLRMIQGTPPGVESTFLLQLALASATCVQKGENKDAQMLVMVVEGWEYYKSPGIFSTIHRGISRPNFVQVQLAPSSTCITSAVTMLGPL